MEFRDNEAIYIQIADYVSKNILLGKWTAEQKIPSVRDLAVDLQVNLNTVMRAYEFLENIGVIYNKRGLGFFVSQNGFDKVKLHRKERFIKQDLPLFFNNIFLLDINKKDLMDWYEQFKRSHKESKSANDDETK